MKSFYLLVILIILSNLSFAQSKFPPSYSPIREYTGQTIHDIIRLPEAEIDIGLATLVLAKEFFPEMNVNYYLDLIDVIAIGVFSLSQGIEDPLVRISSMNTFFYRKGAWNKFQPLEYDLDDLEAKELKNRFLNEYLDTKHGSCITMPMLHIVVGQRLGWPIYAVGSPKHFFCRYLKPGFSESNIEATSGGGFIPDSSYINDTGIPDNALQNGVYLRNLRNKEYIGRLISINASVYYEMGNIGKAIEYLQLAKKLDPTFSSAFWNLGLSYVAKAEQLKQKMNNEIELEGFLSGERMKKKNDPHLIQTNPHKNANLFDLLDLAPKPFAFGKYPLGRTRETSNQAIARLKTKNQIDQNLQVYIDAICINYSAKIDKYLNLSEENLREAKRLGIVLKFPEQFLLKQSKSILNFKEKGEH